MWNKVADKYIFDVYAKDGNRKKALLWKTLYNKMSKQNAFNNKKNKAYDENTNTLYSSNTKSVVVVREPTANNPTESNSTTANTLPNPTN